MMEYEFDETVPELVKRQVCEILLFGAVGAASCLFDTLEQLDMLDHFFGIQQIVMVA
jgi:hypothetical protein